MPRIIASHRLAHRAVLAVCSVLNRAGALTEVVKNDYGEDLLVQTQLRDIADNFHILVQVKGLKLKTTRNDKCRFSIDVLHLQRWASHIQPVLVCVFDEVSERIFAFYPRKEFSLWSLSITNRKFLTLKLGSENLFDDRTASRFIWECRIEYFSRMLAWYENEFRYASHHAKTMHAKRRAVSEGNLIVFTFVESLGIFGRDDEIVSDFRKSIENASKNFARRNAEHPKDPDPLILRDVFMLSLLGFVEKSTGTGLPLNLLQHATDLVGSFFRRRHRDEWLRAAQRVNDVGWLSGKAVRERAGK